MWWIFLHYTRAATEAWLLHAGDYGIIFLVTSPWSIFTIYSHMFPLKASCLSKNLWNFKQKLFIFISPKYVHISQWLLLPVAFWSMKLSTKYVLKENTCKNCFFFNLVIFLSLTWKNFLKRMQHWLIIHQKVSKICVFFLFRFYLRRILFLSMDLFIISHNKIIPRITHWTRKKIYSRNEDNLITN